MGTEPLEFKGVLSPFAIGGRVDNEVAKWPWS
jgi:hypothetical protein